MPRPNPPENGIVNVIAIVIVNVIGCANNPAPVDAGPDLASPESVACSFNQGAPCPLSTAVCCIHWPTFDAQCEQTCPAGYDRIACDGPEDCAGSLCCGTYKLSARSFSTACAPACAMGSARVCHLASDCAQGEKCCTFDATMLYRMCTSSPPLMTTCS